MEERAAQSILIFVHALNWELTKAYAKNPEEWSARDRVKFIEEYPEADFNAYHLLGPKWLEIAKVLESSTPDFQRVDKLIDMDHNFGNVLTRIVSKPDKYLEFLTVKTHNTHIIEFVPFISGRLKSEVLKASKRYENFTLQDYKETFMELTQGKYAQIQMSNATKDIDLENIKRLLEQCEHIGADEVCNRLLNDEYAWSGKFQDVDLDALVLFNAKFLSGSYKNCFIKGGVIEGGFFQNCVLDNVIIAGSPTIMESAICKGNIPASSKATFIKTQVVETANASREISTVDTDKIPLTIVL